MGFCIKNTGTSTLLVFDSNTDKVSIGEYYIITLDAGEAETKGLRLTTKCIGE